MSDDDEDTGTVLVFRNNNGAPIAVPEDIVEENDRTFRAAQMQLQGASWKAIALAEGYVDANAAKSDVKRYRDEATALLTEHSRKDLLALEVARLDALQAAVWQQAMKGHLPAVNVVRDLIMSRIKVLQLDQPSQEEEITGPRTVVIPHDDDEYAAELQRAIDSTP